MFCFILFLINLKFIILVRVERNNNNNIKFFISRSQNILYFKKPECINFLGSIVLPSFAIVDLSVCFRLLILIPFIGKKHSFIIYIGLLIIDSILRHQLLFIFEVLLGKIDNLNPFQVFLCASVHKFS